MMTYAFNSKFQYLGGRGKHISEFKGSLVVYRESSIMARDTKGNPVLRKQKEKKEMKAIIELEIHL